MSLLVVGSVAIDSVHTPHGDAENVLGGSASYFAQAAAFFGPVRMVGVVGDDFPEEHLELFRSRGNIDTQGVRRVAGKTFFWRGKYSANMNHRETLEVHLNVFGEFDPDVPEAYRDSPYVFLANASPVVQRKVLHQMRSPKLVVADTMDLWITTQRDELRALLPQVHGLVLNDEEAKQLSEIDALLPAGAAILKMGPQFVIVKKGEHGSMLFTPHGVAALPAFPTPRVLDPTGAGDAFAGAMMGSLAAAGGATTQDLKRAMAYGTAVASLVVEDFSLRRILAADRAEIDHRLQQFRDMVAV